MPYYKGVRIVDGVRVSLTHKLLHGDWVVEYPIGEWVEGPHDSGLFIESRAVHYPGAEVWLVHAKEVTPVEVVVHTMLTTCPSALQSFWDAFYDENHPLHTRLPPDYMRVLPCFVARRVRLVRCVRWADSHEC